MSKIKKRFIAGAICPNCKQPDTIRIYQQEGDTFRECIACDFVEQQSFNTSPRELTTRVNQREVDVQVLDIKDQT